MPPQANNTIDKYRTHMPSSKNHPYLPHTPAERKEMLKVIGVETFEQLLTHIPAEIRAGELSIADGLSELELTQYISKLSEKNKPASRHASFLGAGSYRRFTPAVVQAVISRSEFATAYTPYQPGNYTRAACRQFTNFKRPSVY